MEKRRSYNFEVKEDVFLMDDINSVRYYLDKINRYRLFSKDEEIEMFQRYAKGNADAKQMLIESNLKLVFSIAKKYVANHGLPLMDLIQEGNIGLIHAIEKFDLRKGCKLSTYATYWIKHAVKRAIMSKSRSVRLPYRKIENMEKMRKAFGRTGELPTREKMAKGMGVTAVEMDKIISIGRDAVSLDSAVFSEDGRTVADSIADSMVAEPETYVFEMEFKGLASKILDALKGKEEQVVRLRYGLANGKCHTLRMVGKKMGLSVESVRQLEIKALQKLRTCNMGLREYL